MKYNFSTTREERKATIFLLTFILIAITLSLLSPKDKHQPKVEIMQPEPFNEVWKPFEEADIVSLIDNYTYVTIRNGDVWIATDYQGIKYANRMNMIDTTDQNHLIYYFQD